MADKNLTVEQGALYMLRWVAPGDVPVTNSFVDPDGTAQDFPHPDPTPEGKTAEKITITLKKGESEETAEPWHFRANRARPTVATQTAKNAKGESKPVNVFSAVFKAREEGVFVFTVTGGGKTLTQKMTVTPASKVYRTIQEVLDDPKAVRRQAVLAAAADLFPAFNTCERGDESWSDPPHLKKEAATHQAGLTVGADSGIVDQGAWVRSYGFCSKTKGTSCTTVNPMVFNPAACPGGGEAKKCGPDHAKHSYWAFDASKNPGWVVASSTKVPSVGDTYVLNNGWNMYTGHVGVVLHVPPDGNGLWVTGDGGQGSKPKQLALLIPRWGLMGAMLPQGGSPQGTYKKMVPEDEGPPFLSGATPGEIDLKAPVPAQNDDVAGIVKRIKFRQTETADAVSNPRRMAGFVNVDSPALKFRVDPAEGQDPTPTDAAVLEKIKGLKARVDKVIAATLAGKVVGGAST